MDKLLRTLKFLIAFLCCLSACSHVPKAPDDPWQQAMRAQGRDITAEVDVVYQAYAIIVDEYVKPIEPTSLCEKALIALQEFIGKERMQFRKDGRSMTVSSAGQTLRIEQVLDCAQGAKEVARTFSFVAAANPRVSPHELAYAAIKGMVALDRQSHHITPEEYNEITGKVPGRAGVGILISKEQDSIVVTLCADGSPAYNAGVLPGDRLTMIDGRPTSGLKIQEISERLGGEKGTLVTLTIEREQSPQPLSFPLVREYIYQNNVQYKLLESHYGYIHILGFPEGTAFELDYGMEQLRRASGKKIKGVILDLRGNPGGRFYEAIELSRRFVESGLIVSVQGRKSNQNGKYFARKDIIYPYPVVVLVDHETAMASELVAGVLQDHHLAIVVGSSTVKDDSIQTLYRLKDGSALKLTTDFWRLPRGISIEATGIVPDVIVNSGSISLNEPERDLSVRTALDILKEVRQDKQKEAPLKEI